jgi:hypothetical protein
MLPIVITFNILRDNDDDVDVNLENTLPMASTTNGTWIHHVQDKYWTAISSKPNIGFVGSPTVII